MTDLQLLAVPVDDLAPSPFNRNVVNDDSLKELTASIAANGVLQALTIRPSSRTGVKYEIVIGEHRWRAAIKAKLAKVPCSLVTATDTDAILMQLEENLKRKDPNALEVGASYLHLSKLGLHPDEIAKKSGKSLAHVYAHLSLNKASEVLRNAVADGSITGSHAARLVTLPEKQHKEFVERIKDQGMSVRELEQDLKQYEYKTLSAAPWKQNDATLDVKAGPCSICPKSTTANDLLRSTLEAKTGVCTDGDCFDRKMTAHIARLLVGPNAPKFRLVGSGGSGNGIPSFDWRLATKKDRKKKIQGGIVVSGKSAGHIVQFVDLRVKKKKSESGPHLFEKQQAKARIRAAMESIWRKEVLRRILVKAKWPTKNDISQLVEQQRIRPELLREYKAKTFGQQVVLALVEDELNGWAKAKELLTLAKRYKINVKKIQSELAPKAKKKGKVHAGNQ